MTYREIMQTKSRTISNYYLNALRPENFILMNKKDAAERDIRNGDKVQIFSATNPEGVYNLQAAGTKKLIGKVKVIEGIRPGVIAFSLGHGHWAMGSMDFELDGKKIKADERRATGIHANAVMRLDDTLKNTCLLDPVGGSVSFYDTKVKVVKV
jgi:anaerobic selenocysteine-containing dehydrogenase